mmetsp:Transcript_17730/g.36712  ORF Transcript_17730/g.36712 Transcript_17730/m.36712 type:complete len:444 (-) Transcript_17730:2727-4058(-)
MAWGAGLKSCSSLLDRVDRNDPTLVELVILSTKTVTASDWDRLAKGIVKHGAARHLKSLQASGHSISKEALRALGQAIHESSQTVPWSLIAVGTTEMGSSGGLEEFMAGLDAPGGTKLQLEYLDLSYKGLDQSNLAPILRLSSSSPGLRVLDLSRNPGLMKGLEALSHDTKMFPFVEQLDVSSCEMDGQNAKALLENLASKSEPCCQTLNLSNNPIGAHPFDVIGSGPLSLQDLNLSTCEIGDHSLSLLSASNSAQSALQSLDLSNNRLSGTSMESFGKWVANTRTLVNLNLSNNPLMVNGVETLIQNGLVPRGMNHRVQTLDLSETQCGKEGAMTAIQSSNAVTLRFFKNQLGPEGFEALAPCLVGGHASLETLDLAANEAPEEAVVDLLRGLLTVAEDDKSTLSTIVVGGNKGGENLEQMVANIKKVRPNVDIARDRIKKK